MSEYTIADAMKFMNEHKEATTDEMIHAPEMKEFTKYMNDCMEKGHKLLLDNRTELGAAISMASMLTVASNDPMARIFSDYVITGSAQGIKLTLGIAEKEGWLKLDDLP